MELGCTTLLAHGYVPQPRGSLNLEPHDLGFRRFHYRGRIDQVMGQN